MDKHIREVLFEPLRKDTLSAIIPDFTFLSGDQEVSAPAQVVRDDDDFQFTLHFDSGKPPTELQSVRGGFFNDDDKKTIRGQINGEISFRCDDVFPPSTMTTRSRGTSIAVLKSHRMNLLAEGTDEMTTEEVRKVIGQTPDDQREKTGRFTAHLIYHGPKLKMFGAGTNVLTRNDFLGEAATSTTDTHQFTS